MLFRGVFYLPECWGLKTSFRGSVSGGFLAAEGRWYCSDLLAWHRCKASYIGHPCPASTYAYRRHSISFRVQRVAGGGVEVGEGQ